MRNILLALGLMIAVTPLLFAGNAGMMMREREDPLEGQPVPQPTLLNGSLQRVYLPRNRNTLIVFFAASDPSPLREAEKLLAEHPKARAVGYAIALARGGAPMPPAGGDGKRGGNPPPVEAAEPLATFAEGGGDSGSARFVLAGNAQGKQPGKNRPGGGAGAAQLQALLEQLRQLQTSLPILIDSGDAAREFQMRAGGAVLADDAGMIRVRTPRLNELTRDRIAQQLALLGGDPPERFGWRNDIVFALDVAQGRRDMQGRPIVPGKGKAMTAPPQVAIRSLQMLVPPTQVAIKVQWEEVPENSRAGVKEALDFAIASWSKALPEIKFSVVEDRDDADLIIGFKSEVLDPRDENGIRTVCSHYRTLDEEARGKGKPAPGNARPDPRNEHRIKTVAQIGWGHLTDGVQHSQRAVAHMVAGGIGSALGLEDRRDGSSVMNPLVDKGNPALTPSKTDLIILQGMGAALYFEIGKQLLETNRTRQAEEAFAKIPPTSRYAEQARAALIEAGAGSGSGPSGKAK